MAPITLQIAPDHPAFAGHFPGHPLLPGVSLLAEVLEAVLSDADSAATVGPQPRIGIAKFLAPVRPAAVLLLTLERRGDSLHFFVHQGGELTASGHFEPSTLGSPRP